MSSEPRNPLDRLIDLAGKLFGACLLVWLAVELLAQVWMWIVGGLLVVGLVVVLWRVYQSRRDIW